ncbi:PREDICTED: uncharacterized protein LOC106503272 [Capra hircus]|uniref:uncharacterized protein LOC106503272 n=1 Tax=Capra hircus TaxID=9925 RepID=UPI000847A631|nr:PREDICTED: uncharacterized protein LOC106503272 [Capra hircus]
MRSAAKPWSPVSRAGSHGVDRPRPLPVPSPGMKSSKSSTSLAFESRLSKLKRASSEDTLNKPGAAAASGAAARLKKTSTSGAISELTESRLRGPSGRREWGQGETQAVEAGRWEGLREVGVGGRGPGRGAARGGSPGRGSPGGSCPFESVSGLRSVRTTLSQELLGDNIPQRGVSYVSGRQTQGNREAVGSPVCPSAPLLVRLFARVAFMGIQAEWYRPWGCLGVLVRRCRRVRGPAGPWRSCPACFLGPVETRTGGCLQSLRRRWPLKAVGILCVSSFLRNRKGFF